MVTNVLWCIVTDLFVKVITFYPVHVSSVFLFSTLTKVNRSDLISQSFTNWKYHFLTLTNALYCQNQTADRMTRSLVSWTLYAHHPPWNLNICPPCIHYPIHYPIHYISQTAGICCFSTFFKAMLGFTWGQHVLNEKSSWSCNFSLTSTKSKLTVLKKKCF